jgi:SAM-dependent methyltransferase
LPLALGWAARRIRELGDPAVRGIPDRQIPPRGLRARTGAPGAREFAEGGRAVSAVLAEAARSAERPLENVGALLDFGCGSGRVLPHVAALASQAECAGCDVDAAAIRWAACHLPELRWSVSGFVPPLPFEDARFDLVYSISVFSHLDEDLQDRWLAEVERVTAPGGVALLSIHGASAFEQFRTGRVSTGWCRSEAFARSPLAADEFVFEPYVRSRWNARDLPGVETGYGLAFHGEGYLRRRWARAFDVREVRERAISGWQDLVLCVKRS